MGNKDAGRAMAEMDNIAYMQAMGAEVTNPSENYYNTGSSFTNTEVLKYFKMLRQWYLDRRVFRSNAIPEQELRLIQWNIFYYGKCAMLKPKIITDYGIENKSLCFTFPVPLIYQCNYTDINFRTGRPRKISIVNNSQSGIVIENEYYEEDFVLFTDQYAFPSWNTPFSNVAWEYANKLHELDLAFNANSHKLRFPLVFNNGQRTHEDDGQRIPLAMQSPGLAELMRSAYGRNEQFVEVPEAMVGVTHGFLFEPAHVENKMLEHIEAQKKLYQSYFELLGLYTNKEKQGSYTVKALQENGDETGDFITDSIKNSLLLCCQEASRKFKIDMSLEVV